MTTVVASSRTERKETAFPDLYPGDDFTHSPLLGRFHENRKILVIDDFTPTLADLQRDLSPYFCSDRGCIVEAESDPQKALKKILDAKKCGMPYDAIVLDLFMPGLHGDELLRRIADDGAFVPTVVHSGSWAEDIQSQLFHNLEHARTRYEIESATREVRQRLDGIPITFVKKFAGDVKDIALALDAVMLVGEETDTDKVNGFVREFKPAIVETSIDREAVSKISELTRWYGRHIGSFLQWAVEKQSEFRETTHYSRIKEVQDIFLGPEYSARALMEEKDHLGAARRHNIPSILLQVTGETGVIQKVPRLREFAPDEDFLQKVRQLEEDAFKFNDQIYMLMGLYQKVELIDVNDSVSLMIRKGHFPKENIFFSPKDEQMHVETPAELFRRMIEQPITNAIKVIKDKPDGKVNVSTKKSKVGSIKDERARNYFIQQGLSGEDFIAEVTVEDNGIGMTPEKLAEVNTPKGDVKSDFGSSGFGLGYVKEYIGRCNGTYAVESTLNEGTIFHMYFKLTESQEKKD